MQPERQTASLPVARAGHARESGVAAPRRAGLHIEQQGAGPDLALLPGWMSDSRCWGATRGLLARRFRLHLVDLPGHGLGHEPKQESEQESEHEPEHGPEHAAAAAWSLRNPRALAAEIARRVPAGAVWLGWSMGALVGMLAAAAAGPRALICAAMSPRLLAARDWPAGMPPTDFARFRTLLRDNPARCARNFVALQCVGERRRRRVASHLADMAGAPRARRELEAGLALLGADLRATAAALTQPVLYLGGAEDRIVSPENLRAAIACTGARAELVEIAGAGHAPQLSNPQAFARAVAEFVGRLD